ncbi:uncharacterized protein N7498_008332 [Penicillium cinerascens]|uniref:Uncharacterized protein n=1 Tax=Penicillium cinerascens TaxID=70096 RepID=A0A9W9JD76_9EURO|nr:uncharacterized protein N7498_008332 [Penicillium cinerascens]KAJ5194894.1 hypothetical protein N7498_008332 [Penicillium cinerascens]
MTSYLLYPGLRSTYTKISIKINVFHAHDPIPSIKSLNGPRP